MYYHPRLNLISFFCLSSEESSASSGLSIHGSAGALSLGSSAEGLDVGSGPKVSPLGQNLELLKGKDDILVVLPLKKSIYLF